jgi:Xaa-Pro dipeptidase
MREPLPRQPGQTPTRRTKKMAKQIANPDLPAPPSGKYPAKSHARRVAKWLAENGGPKEGVIYLEGQALREHEV